jgi:uncharacterized protein (DUF2225 family)
MAIIDENGVRRRLIIMLGTEALADDYIRRYGYTIHIAKVNGLRFANEYREKMRRGGVVTEEPKTDRDDPLFQIHVKCPACYAAEIPLWEQKARSLTTVPDRFQMPSYKPVGTFHAVDYNLLAVTICPQCLYASPDKKDFICLDPRRNEVPARLHQGDLAAILADADNRTSVLEASGLNVPKEHLFARERTAQAALVAYQLAMERARIESARNVAFSRFKMGGYALKQALLVRTYGVGDEKTYLEKALELYKQSYESSNAPGAQYEGWSLYEIVALNLRLGNETEAGAFLGALDKAKAEMATMDSMFLRWYNMTRDLWSDRDNPELWKH